MEVGLVGSVGLPISILTIVFQFNILQSFDIMYFLVWGFVIGEVLFYYFIKDRKEKMEQKLLQLDSLIIEIGRSCPSGG